VTPAPRTARSIEEVLGLALEDLEAGLTPLQVLDRYPQYEAELAPLLETAYRLHTTRWPALSAAARVSGRERMHAALAEQKGPRWFILAPIWRQLGAGLVLTLLAGMAFLASPVSPLRSLNRPRLTGTAPVTTTATWTSAPSATSQPLATVAVLATRGPTTTVTATETAQPTEEVDPELGLKHSPPKAPPTLWASATPTRVTPTRRPTATATATPVPTDTPTETPEPTTTTTSPPPAGATSRPPSTPTSVVSPTVPATTAPTYTPVPTATHGKPTATATAKPTKAPDATATARPGPTATSGPPTVPPLQPTQTSQPTAEPTSVDKHPTAVKTPTPGLERATHTPEPDNASVTAKGPAAAGVELGAALRKLVVEVGRGEDTPPGQVIREAVREWRRAEPPPRSKNNRQ
jgi:hypothetical protein